VAVPAVRTMGRSVRWGGPYDGSVSTHVAQVEWHRDGAPTDSTYSRAHVWRFDGGVEVPASSAPHLNGDPARVDPEEAFVAAIASCHMLWFLHLASDAGFPVETYRDDAVATMGRVEDGVLAITDVELHPVITWSGPEPDDAALAQLHRDSHHRCFIANSVRSNITVAGT